MKTALYPDHHCLPFWRKPTQPTILFNEIKLASYAKKGTDEKNILLASQSDIWPVLLGLNRLQVPAMAHVSIVFDPKTYTFDQCKRMWVQISELPEQNDENGIPLVVNEGKVQVSCLWGIDNGTRSPLDFLSEEEWKDDSKKKSPEFWANLFGKKLLAEYEKLKSELDTLNKKKRVLEKKTHFLNGLILMAHYDERKV